MAASASLMLHLTGRCNLECRHCYMEGGPWRRERLPFDWIVDSLGVAPELGIGSVFFTGGEPLMYPRLAELARVAAAGGLSTTICTNATLVRAQDADLFASLGLNVHVSIDGTADYHDYFRAVDGAFRKAERGVKLLVGAGVPLTVVTTISRANLHQFSEITQWANDAGAHRLLVQPLLDLGRGTAIRSQQLSSAELLKLIMMTSDLAHSPGRRIKPSIIGGSKRFLLAHPCAAYVCNGAGCHRGVSAEIKKLVVREDGTILPEVTNLDHRYAIGNVADGPLRNLVRAFFATRYAEFDRLCRTTYEEFVPDWPDPIVPWDQLLAMRSRTELPLKAACTVRRDCGGSPAPSPMTA